MKNRFVWMTMAALVVAGVGCNWFSQKVGPKLASMTPSGPKPVDFQGLDPVAATQRVNLVQGSQIEVRQTYLGLGAKAAAESAGNDKEGVRIITIERFAPMNYADLSWKLSSRIETDASRQARKKYEEQQAQTSTAMASSTPPEAVTEMQSVAGGLSGIDLKKTHDLYPLAYWPSQKDTAKGTSAIWLSEDAFDELAKTQHATLYLGFLDGQLNGALKASSDFASAIHNLQSMVDEASKQGDPDWAAADIGPSDWSLKINGQDATVKVLKVHDWYGEIVVLDNPQNPLILKMSFAPQNAGPSDQLQGDTLLPSLFSYEVTSLDNVQ